MKTSPRAMLLALAAAPWCVCAPRSAATLVVIVRNYAHAPRSEMVAAVGIAREALRSAGVESQWAICAPESCEASAPLPESGLKIELFVMPTLQAPPPEGASHPAGYAMMGGSASLRGYAFYDAAQSASAGALRPISLVLGCILIHEAGHLLGLSHQAHGVMRANLDGVDMDNAVRGWAFNSKERRELRAAVGRAQAMRAIAHR
jgi:hypothetical protein